MNTFERDGFLVVKDAVPEEDLKTLLESVEALQRDGRRGAPGIRRLLRRSEAVAAFAKSARILEIVGAVLGSRARPVRGILFDKTPSANWYVTWHQDLTIAVKERIDVAGFGPWSIKEEIQHVQPPVSVLENMVSVRVHLDSCREENGPIKFVPGSHKAGVLSPLEIDSWRVQNEPVLCTAERGDLILMRPLILHSSSQATNPAHRRVLHLEYAGCDLPGGLRWAEASGLDSVELVLAIEEEFGLEIPDKDAERLYTVGETYAYLCRRLASTPAADCLSQKIFYKVRRALIENFEVRRESITPETRMTDVLSREDLEEGWPYLQMFIDMRTPDFKRSNEILGLKLADTMLTMRDLVSGLISLNSAILVGETDTDQEIWRRLVDVIVRQANVSREEIVPEASFSRDLGIC